jgi:hypothetical protein
MRMRGTAGSLESFSSRGKYLLQTANRNRRCADMLLQHRRTKLSCRVEGARLELTGPTLSMLSRSMGASVSCPLNFSSEV